MATSFGLAGSDIRSMLNSVIETYHTLLHEAGVTIGIIMAANEDGPAIKVGGYADAACVKVVSLKDRLTKSYDAELLIDHNTWTELSYAGRVALLDHEMSHLELSKIEFIRDSENPEAPLKLVCGRDDYGRPKLKLRPGDWNAGDGFKAVVERHGDAAIEVRNLQHASKLAGVESGT